MWKMQFLRDADVSIGHILAFAATGIALVYAVDAIYQYVKKRQARK